MTKQSNLTPVNWPLSLIPSASEEVNVKNGLKVPLKDEPVPVGHIQTPEVQLGPESLSLAGTKFDTIISSNIRLHRRPLLSRMVIRQLEPHLHGLVL